MTLVKWSHSDKLQIHTLCILTSAHHIALYFGIKMRANIGCSAIANGVYILAVFALSMPEALSMTCKVPLLMISLYNMQISPLGNDLLLLSFAAVNLNKSVNCSYIMWTAVLPMNTYTLFARNSRHWEHILTGAMWPWSSILCLSDVNLLQYFMFWLYFHKSGYDAAYLV